MFVAMALIRLVREEVRFLAKILWIRKLVKVPIDHQSIKTGGHGQTGFRHALKWTSAGIVPRCFAVI